MQNGIGVVENAAERARRRAANGETALFDARLVDEAHVAAPAPVIPQAPSDACAQLAEHAEVIPLWALDRVPAVRTGAAGSFRN